MAKIFVSYRREDSPGHAGRLYDHLVSHFGEQQIFRDIEAIEYGVDFVEAIQAAVGSCDILVAVIGPEWVTIQDKEGHRRLDNPKDFVRLEVAEALARDIRVIPVLVSDAAMPAEADLPPDLAPLARRNGIEISDIRFRADVDRLVHSIEAALHLGPPPVVPEAATVSVPSPRPAPLEPPAPVVPPPEPRRQPSRSNRLVVLGIVAIAAALVVVLALLFLPRRGGAPVPPPAQPTATTSPENKAQTPAPPAPGTPPQAGTAQGGSGGSRTAEAPKSKKPKSKTKKQTSRATAGAPPPSPAPPPAPKEGQEVAPNAIVGSGTKPGAAAPDSTEARPDAIVHPGQQQQQQQQPASPPTEETAPDVILHPGQ